MNKKKSAILKSKLTYLRCIYKITEHINRGKKPEEELKNLGVVSYYG